MKAVAFSSFGEPPLSCVESQRLRCEKRMSNPAIIHEEVHLCARCKAIIEPVHTESLKEDSGIRRVEDLVTTESDPFKQAPVAVVAEPTKTLFVPIEAPASAEMPVAAQVPEEEQGPEHRTAPRKKLEVDVGIRSDSHFFAGLSGDVSKGGLFVATYAEIPIGGKVTLDFELPNGPIVVQGTVRWQRIATDNAGPGLGIQFESIARDQLALIERFCQARPPLYYDQADDDF
jgi:uncharacterized protein (TIGR02266 family)